jgi:hypothetical protein
MMFPDELTNAVDGLTEIEAAHLNNLEAKVGINGSTDPTSLDYLLKNPASLDPGHKHTAGAFSGGSDGEVFFKDPADHAWKPAAPDAAGLVARTGDQNIAGVKTFTSIPVLPASDPTAGNEAVRKGYVDAAIDADMAAHTALPNAHHGQAHDIQGTDHTASGLTAGQVLRATGSSAFEFQALQEADLPSHKHSGLFKPDGSTQAVFVDADGNFGVGVADPTYEFEIEKTDANCRLAIIAKGTGQYSNLNLGNASVATAGQVRYDHSVNRLEFTTNNVAQRLIIDSSGNVGIKTTAFGAAATRTLGIQSGTAPTTSVADVVQLFSADVNGEAGKAGLHLMNEVPAGVKLIVPGVYLKASAGDPGEYFEGMLVINTVDNTLKMYADGGFRQLASWS